MDVKRTGAVTGNFHLTTGEHFFAKDANALVVQRFPVPEIIRGSQRLQALIQLQVGSICHVTTLPGSWLYTIGCQNDYRIGENLTRPLMTIRLGPI